LKKGILRLTVTIQHCKCLKKQLAKTPESQHSLRGGSFNGEYFVLFTCLKFSNSCFFKGEEGGAAINLSPS